MKDFILQSIKNHKKTQFFTFNRMGFNAQNIKAKNEGTQAELQTNYHTKNCFHRKLLDSFAFF